MADPAPARRQLAALRRSASHRFVSVVCSNAIPPLARWQSLAGMPCIHILKILNGLGSINAITSNARFGSWKTVSSSAGFDDK
jgi:hypothetical protein